MQRINWGEHTPTQKDFLIYHHMGLGDFINCNGLVRKLYHDLSFDNFYVMTKDMFFDQISFMYRDLDKLICLKAPDDAWGCPTQAIPHKIFDGFPGMKIKLFMWHLSPKVYVPPDEELEYIHDMYWYICLGYSPSVMHDYFHIPRDLSREAKAFSDIVGDDFDGEYVFVADDPNRQPGVASWDTEVCNYEIDVSKVYPNNDYRIIRSNDYLHLNYTIFDLIGIMEKAKSCHVMWSNLFKLCDYLNPGFTDIYLHETYLNNGKGKQSAFQSESENVRNIYRKFVNDRNITLVE